MNTTSPIVISCRYDGTNLDPADGPVRVNGSAASVTEIDSPDAPTDTIDLLTFGRGYASNFWDGQLYEVVFYVGGQMTAAQVALVEEILNDIHGVY